MKKIIGAIKGRHEMPVSEFIFDEAIIDPTDIASINSKVNEALQDASSVTLYVTGLTVVTTAVVRYCFVNCMGLELMHFDNATGEYFSQVIIDSQDSACLNTCRMSGMF